MTVEVVYFPGLYRGMYPGYTDYVKAYVSRDFGPKDREILVKHELAHIYLQHNTRSMDIPDRDPLLWNVALDLEIAYHIYTEEDENILHSPFSALGRYRIITKENCKRFPGCQFAEEFYPLLKKDEWDPTHDGEINEELSKLLEEMLKDLKVDLGGGVNPHDLVQAAKGAIAEYVDNIRAANKLTQAVESFPPPSLASEIDAHIGRAKVEVVKSYRRPSRRESLETGLMRKGRTLKRKAPRVVIYVDRSGSFDASKTAIAERTLKEVLQAYRANVDCDVLYFSDRIFKLDKKQGGGGTNYATVWDNIVKDRAEVAVVITDSDPCPPLPPSDCKVIVYHIGGGNSHFGKMAKAAVFKGQ